MGDPFVYRPLSLLLVDLATPTGRLPLDKVVDGFLAVEVVPQPLYPAPSVCVISEGSSPLVLATTGRVGSLLGLNPYSSTSFLRSSSASFLCFRLRQRKRAARTISATATTGTTTATAMVPPGERPEVEEALAPEVARAAEPDLLEDELLEEAICVTVPDGKRWPLSVEVITTVAGSGVPFEFVVVPLAAIVVTKLTADEGVIVVTAAPGPLGVTVVLATLAELPELAPLAVTVVEGGCDVVEIDVTRVFGARLGPGGEVVDTTFCTGTGTNGGPRCRSQ